VGENAGASKLEKIKKADIKTLNEDEFLNLIATRKGAELDEKQIKAKEKEEQKIRDAAKEMEQREKEEEKLRKRKEKAMEGAGMAAKLALSCV
jgi:replication factor C subunit 1